jgi:cytochrome o ubiquinol oxidase operon protein cyoD
MTTHDQHLDHGHAPDAHAHGTMRGYVIGFVLSVILTAIPFWLVMSHTLGSNALTAAAILALAFAQIIVHMFYFLHMNTRSENGWTAMALIFTAVLVVIALTGTLWVMHHLDVNMMPMSTEQMRNMP